MLYIFLCTLTEEGQQAMLRDPEVFSKIADEIHLDGAQILARYAVLGRYDYVAMVEARTHEDAARLSLELGARSRVHIETLITIAVRQLADTSGDLLEEWTSAGLPTIPGLSPPGLSPSDNPPPDFSEP